MFGRVFRGFAYYVGIANSKRRALAISLQYPEVSFEGSVFVSSDCSITAGRGASVRIVACHISPGVTITALPGASLIIEADFLAPGVTIVARESVLVGEGSQLGEYCSVRDHNHVRGGDGTLSDFVTSPVVLGARTWLGARSAVLMGVTIGADVTVGANAVVTRSLPAGCVAVGVPARVL